MNWEDISEDARKKAMECKSPEELLELAKEEGVKLTDEQIEAISGGSSWSHGHNCRTLGLW